MRSYIFTERERQIIRRFLDGMVERDDPLLMVILSRVKRFAELRNDVDLYVRLREAVSTRFA
ncbi:MAG: hypothetical protein ACPLYF_02755 [Fervidobacterium sp.]